MLNWVASLSHLHLTNLLIGAYTLVGTAGGFGTCSPQSSSPDTQVLLGLLVRSFLKSWIALRFPRPKFEEPGQALGTNKKFAFVNFLHSSSFRCQRRDSYLIWLVEVIPVEAPLVPFHIRVHLPPWQVPD